MAVFNQSQPMSPIDYQDRAVQRLAEWAHAADAAYAVATKLVQSAFVPVQFRGKPVDATAAILAGSEVGLSPVAALRAFDVIGGVAAPRAITLRAIAQSFGHSMVLVESTATRCRMKGRRKGEAEWQDITWTMDRARDLGLTGKDPWKKQPQAMLLARATSELARLIAADAILGIGYSLEEIADDVAVGFEPAVSASQRVTPVPTPAAPSGTRRMSRPKPAAVEPESAPAEPAVEAPVEMITAPQLKRLHAMLGERGYGKRDVGLAVLGEILGRDVASTKDLTLAEASTAMDALDAESAEQADPWLSGESAGDGE
jgi:hypothetical protein